MNDPRIPKPRALPASLAPKPIATPEKPEEPVFPTISNEIVAFLEKQFPEKTYEPESVTTERVWYDLGIRRMVHWMRAVNREQNAK